MWFAIPIAAAVLFVIIGLIAGGPFTAVFIPLAIIAIVGGFLFSAWSRSQSGSGGRGQRAQTGDPLPHQGRSNVPSSPTTPDQLADARRQQQ